MVGLVEVAVAPALPGVQRDLESVQTVFQGRLGGVWFGDDATVANAKRALGHAGLLLLATHGTNLADRPLESFLVLQPQEGNDGHSTAAELFETRVGADLVVMNACYSGLADASPLPGDDLFGLQRALLQAARTVVAGLWDVYDGTAPELIRGVLRAWRRARRRRRRWPSRSGNSRRSSCALRRSGAVAAPLFLGRVHRGGRRPHRDEEISHEHRAVLGETRCSPRGRHARRMSLGIAAASLPAPAADAPPPRSWTELTAQRQQLIEQYQSLLAGKKMDEAMAAAGAVDVERQLIASTATDAVQKEIQQACREPLWRGSAGLSHSITIAGSGPRPASVNKSWPISAKRPTARPISGPSTPASDRPTFRGLPN